MTADPAPANEGGTGVRLAFALLVGTASFALGGAQDFPAPAGSPAPAAPRDGSKQVTREAGVDAMPAWMPDGRRIVFHARRPTAERDKLPTRKIWIALRDGTEAKKLSDGTGDEYHPMPSPDGRKIAFVSESSGNRDIWVMDATGQNPLPLTDEAGIDEHPCWSPDGKRIAWVSLPKDGGNFDLWTMNADGSGKRKLTFTAANELFPAWHPTRDEIAVVTDVAGNYDLHAIDLEGERSFALVGSAAHETRPAWSPDGSKLAFARWPADRESDEARLFVANGDGSGAVELELPRSSTHAAWAPDGRTIAFQRRTETGWDVFVAELPTDVAKKGRLHLAGRLRGGGSRDLVTLRDGSSVSGRIAVETFRVRASYAQLAFPRRAVAALEFAGLEKGTARMVLGNGDAVSGIFLEDAIIVESAAGTRTIAKERIERLALAASPDEPPVGPMRLVMKNGDALTGRLATNVLRIRVGSQAVDLPITELARATFADDGDRATLVTRKGDTLAGRLETGALRFTLASGPALDVSPSYVRALDAGGGKP